MSLRVRKKFLFAGFFALVLGPAPLCHAQNRLGERMSPAQVYDKAWNVIKDSFYLQTFSTPPAQPQDWGRWRHRYDGKLQTEDDADKAIQTMILSLGDPQTEFLNRDAFGEEKSLIQARLFGVGVQIGMSKDYKVVVTAVTPDTPAERGGLRPGDEITDVDAKPIQGMPLAQINNHIRGARGTKVSIGIARGTGRKIVSLVRGEVSVNPIPTAEVLKSGGSGQKIGYIRLNSFGSNSAAEMKKALDKVQGEGATGIILDLRDNFGGLLQPTIEIADMFIDSGVIFSAVDSDGYKTSTMADSRQAKVVTLPMVVLISSRSACASEMLAGCLHDRGRATLVGETTRGRGLVTATNPMGDGSGIRVSVARFLTPVGMDFDRVGITPDTPVVLKAQDYNGGRGPWWMGAGARSPNDGKDVQLNRAVEILLKKSAEVSPAAK